MAHNTNISLLFQGYGRQFMTLRKFLSEQPFADKIEVVGIKDSGITGNFVSGGHVVVCDEIISIIILTHFNMLLLYFRR